MIQCIIHHLITLSQQINTPTKSPHHWEKKQQNNYRFKKPRRERASENPTIAPETGRENPAPASIPGAGAGAISLSWAETTANAAIARRRKNALEIVTWAAIPNYKRGYRWKEKDG